MKLIDCIKGIPNPMSMVQLIKEGYGPYGAVDFSDRTPYEYNVEGPFEFDNMGHKQYFWKFFRRKEGSDDRWQDYHRYWSSTPDPEEGEHELDIIRQLEQEKREKQAESDKRWNDRPKVPYKPTSPDDYYGNRKWSGD